MIDSEIWQRYWLLVILGLSRTGDTTKCILTWDPSPSKLCMGNDDILFDRRKLLERIVYQDIIKYHFNKPLLADKNQPLHPRYITDLESLQNETIVSVTELDGSSSEYFLEDPKAREVYYARTELCRSESFVTLSYSLRGNHKLTCTLTGSSPYSRIPSVALLMGPEEIMRRSRLFHYICNSQTIENDNSGNYFARAAKGLAAEFIQANKGNRDVK